MNIEKVIREKQGTIVDVRTNAEYSSGHAAGSINIPMNEVPLRIEEFKNLKSPVVLCCASGGRSGQTYHYLKEQSVECLDAGSWLNVNDYQS
jgi:phage shock protein E